MNNNVSEMQRDFRYRPYRMGGYRVTGFCRGSVRGLRLHGKAIRRLRSNRTMNCPECGRWLIRGSAFYVFDDATVAQLYICFRCDLIGTEFIDGEGW